MNVVLETLAPSATKLIRGDHTKVLALFHRYEIDSAPATKQALIDAITLSVEIHAQLEEEIFYPAIREVDASLVEKSIPEHDEVRRLMSSLRNMPPTSPHYDGIVMELMRNVIHHVAEEETVMLPQAERLLPQRLGELGARMMKRKLELMMERPREVARNAVTSIPLGGVLAGAGVLVALAVLLKQGRRD